MKARALLPMTIRGTMPREAGAGQNLGLQDIIRRGKWDRGRDISTEAMIMF